MKDNRIISADEVRELLKAHEELSVIDFLSVTDDGTLKLDTKKLMATHSFSIKRIRTKDGNITWYYFHNGQSVNVKENGIVTRVKTSKLKKYQ